MNYKRILLPTLAGGLVGGFTGSVMWGLLAAVAVSNVWQAIEFLRKKA